MGQEESRSEEMDLAQIQELCILFMKECPSGALHLHEFKRIFGVPSSSAEESLYIETIFRSFDTNQVRGRDPASGLWPLGSGLWALGSGLRALGSGLCFFSAFCSLLEGQHAGLPGVRGGAAPHPAGEPGGPTQVVLQDVRQGREREAGPPRGQAAHQGQTFDQTLRTEFTPRTRAFIMSLAAPSPPQPFRSISTCLTGLAPPGVMSYLSGSGSISGVGLTRFSTNGHSARLHFHF